VAMALCFLAYVSVSTLGMALAREVRAHQLAGRELAGTGGSSHVLWHSVYIGYGYLPNRWDIRYQDLVAYRDVLREDPKALYLGPAYGRILRARYFELVRDDPLYAVRVYAAKALTAIGRAGPGLMVLALLAPWLMAESRRRGRWRRDAGYLVLVGLVAMLPPLVATPDSGYLLGWLGAVVSAVILAGAAFVADWSPPSWSPRGVVSPGVALTSTAAFVIAAGLWLFVAPSVEASAAAWLAKKPPVRVVQPPDATH
jgi:hypothetical protein